MDGVFEIPADPQIERMDIPAPEWPVAHVRFEEGEAERTIEAYRKAHFDERLLAHHRAAFARGGPTSGTTLFATAPADEVRELVLTQPLETWIFFTEQDVRFLLALLGDAVIPRLLQLHAAGKLDPVGLLRIVAPETVLVAASHVGAWSIETRLMCLSWLAREGELALPVLLHAVLTKDGDGRAAAQAALRWLSKRDGGQAVRELGKKWNVESVERILAPPARGFRDKTLIPKSWGRIEPPLWRDGTSLSKDDLARLLGFLAAEPHVGHPSTSRVLDAFDPESLRTWVTALDAIWTAKGSVLTHLWLLHAMCLVHGDAGIRRIGAWARAKSTSSNRNERTRSGKAIEVLLELDSAVAVAQLADIAVLAKADAARQRADAAFKIKLLETNQSAESVLDRVVPDLGFSEGVVFDYGPRRFTAVIESNLDIVLTDESGARLSDLPAARKTDDKQKAKAAVGDWRAFKKDATALIDVQRKRLEQAMTSGRRMRADTFRQHVLSNPILATMARGLVWGAWSGATLRAFRVAEDLTFADAHDRALEITDGDICVLHPLEIENASAWHERFQDYEIIQPFEQLARQTFRTRAQAELAECKGWVASAGAIVGLLREGWTPTYPIVEGITRQLAEDREAQVGVSPGFELSAAASERDQVLGTLRISAGLLRDSRIEIVQSELLRELSRACRKGNR